MPPPCCKHQPFAPVREHGRHSLRTRWANNNAIFVLFFDHCFRPLPTPQNLLLLPANRLIYRPTLQGAAGKITAYRIDRDIHCVFRLLLWKNGFKLFLIFFCILRRYSYNHTLKRKEQIFLDTFWCRSANYIMTNVGPSMVSVAD